MQSDLSYFVCLDIVSGTFMAADGVCLIDTRDLSTEELDQLNEGTDTERALLADRHGLPVRTS